LSQFNLDREIGIRFKADLSLYDLAYFGSYFCEILIFFWKRTKCHVGIALRWKT